MIIILFVYLLLQVQEVKSELTESLAQQEQLEVELAKRDELLIQLFKTSPSNDWQSLDVTITWYSLSVDETDGDPNTAAHGPSRPFMAAVPKRIVKELDLKPGDKLAVLSDDNEIAAVVIYWDKLNKRYNNQYRIDLVAPNKHVAKQMGIRPGKVIKL